MVMLPRTSRLRVFAGVTVIYLVAGIILNVAGQTATSNSDANLPECDGGHQ